MSTENAKIDIRGRQAELKLTFQYAQHMMDNFLTSNPPHDLNFEDIQRVAKKAEYKKLHNRIWEGLAKHNNKIYRIIVILERNFPIVKTCYYIRNVKD